MEIKEYNLLEFLHLCLSDYLKGLNPNTQNYQFSFFFKNEIPLCITDSENSNLLFPSKIYNESKDYYLREDELESFLGFLFTKKNDLKKIGKKFRVNENYTLFISLIKLTHIVKINLRIDDYFKTFDKSNSKFCLICDISSKNTKSLLLNEELKLLINKIKNKLIKDEYEKEKSISSPEINKFIVSTQESTDQKVLPFNFMNEFPIIKIEEKNFKRPQNIEETDFEHENKRLNDNLIKIEGFYF